VKHVGYAIGLEHVGHAFGAQHFSIVSETGHDARLLLFAA